MLLHFDSVPFSLLVPSNEALNAPAKLIRQFIPRNVVCRFGREPDRFVLLNVRITENQPWLWSLYQRINVGLGVQLLGRNVHWCALAERIEERLSLF